MQIGTAGSVIYEGELSSFMPGWRLASGRMWAVRRVSGRGGIGCYWKK